MRTWRQDPWGFLPPPIQSAHRGYYTMLKGLPDEVRRGMEIRGCSFTGFPNPRLAQLAGNLSREKIETIRIENERFRAVLAPSLGPRVIELHDKELDLPLALPFTCMNTALIGLTGAWILGGVEFNPFRLGHSVFIGQQIPVDEIDFDDEDRGLRFKLFDELVNMEVTITLRLFPDGISWRATLENHLDVGQPLYYYTNIAVPCGEDTVFLFEPGPVTHHNTNPGFTTGSWPTINGRNYSRWGAHAGVVSAYFYRYGKPYIGFWEPSCGAAMLHAAETNPLRGRKIWSIGARDAQQIWWPRCYERGFGSYCEIQAGLSPAQIQYGWIKPREILSWTETITGLPFTPSATYAGTWSDFAERADRLDLLRGHGDETRWRQKDCRIMISPSQRWLNSKAALKLASAGSVDEAQLQILAGAESLKAGWVAGAAWAYVLRMCRQRGRICGWAKLQLAAGFAVENKFPEALEALNEEPADNELLLALWLRLKAAVSKASGDSTQACGLIERSLGLPDAGPMWWKEAFEYRRAAGDIVGRERLLSICPQNIVQMDSLRFEAAYLHFHQGRFSESIKTLSATFTDVGENSFGQWLLWRESWMAWGLSLWQAGDASRAYEKLFQVSQDASQFGVGRYEVEDSGASYFYRWLLSAENGDGTHARAVATQALRFVPHPSSESAAYLLRLATLVRHASTRQRREQIVKWRADEAGENIKEPFWRSAIMDTIDKGAPSPLWRQISKLELLGYRAIFEAGRR